MNSLGYIHTPIAEHHRWAPYSRRSIGIGQGSADRAARLMLHQMRWRKPPRRPLLALVSGLVTILVHLLGLAAMLLVRPPLPPPPPSTAGAGQAIEVRFIASSPAPPAPPPIPSLLPLPASRQSARAQAGPMHPPSKAPRLAPVPVPPMRPLTQVPPSATPRLHIVVPHAPAVAAVAPVKAAFRTVLPKVSFNALPAKPVLESSPMAIAVPRPTVRPVGNVAIPKAELPELPRPSVHIGPEPIALQQPRPVPRQQDVTTARIAPVSPTPVPSVDLPVPEIASRPPVVSQVKVPVNRSLVAQTVADVAVARPASVNAPAAAAAPLAADTVRIEPPSGSGRVQVVATAATLARVSSVHVPPKASTVRPARVTSVAFPSATSWARQDDTFAPARRSAGPAGSPTPRNRKVPAYIQRQPRGNSDVMTRQYRGFHYKHTLFEQYWAPANQDLLTSMLQDLVDALSFRKTFDLGHGVRIHCGGWLLGFGCGGDPPQPPSDMGDDPRLNMAPPKPLVPVQPSTVAPPPLPAPASSRRDVLCETARVAGGPLPPQCAGSNVRQGKGP